MTLTRTTKKNLARNRKRKLNDKSKDPKTAEPEAESLVSKEETVSPTLEANEPPKEPPLPVVEVPAKMEPVPSSPDKAVKATKKRTEKDVVVAIPDGIKFLSSTHRKNYIRALKRKALHSLEKEELEKSKGEEAERLKQGDVKAPTVIVAPVKETIAAPLKTEVESKPANIPVRSPVAVPPKALPANLPQLVKPQVVSSKQTLPPQKPTQPEMQQPPQQPEASSWAAVMKKSAVLKTPSRGPPVHLTTVKKKSNKKIQLPWEPVDSWPENPFPHIHISESTEQEEEPERIAQKTGLEREQEQNPHTVKPAPKPMKLVGSPQKGKQNLLDLVFVIDCTGSMGSYIANVQIVEQIASAENVDIQFALIQYRDLPPQDSTFATKVSHFTKDLSTMLSYVKSMSASGGGDQPECVASALNELLSLPFRITATKVCVLITDAPPHGLIGKDHGDGFPDGDPGCPDILEVIRVLAVNDVILYTVGCEPAISYCSFSRDFMNAIASMCNGRYVPLSDVQMLPKIIVGGAREEIQLDNLQEVIMDEVRALRKAFKDLLEEEIATKVAESLQKKGITLVQLQTQEIGKSATPYADCIRMSSTLTKARVALTRMPDPTTNTVDSTKFSEKGHLSVEEKLISKRHISRVMGKKL